MLRAGEPLEVRAGPRLVDRLAEHLAVDHDLGVAGDHEGVRVFGRDGLGFPGGVADDEFPRLTVRLLLDLRSPDLERRDRGPRAGARR